MRIGIDATSLPAAVAGAGRYIFGLISGLSRLDSEHEFLIFCKHRDQGHFRSLPENFTVRTIPDYSRWRRLFWQIGELQHVLARDTVEVWHATHYVTPIAASRTPVVATIHDLTFFEFASFYSRHKRYFFRWAIKHALRSAWATVAVSRTTQKDVARLFPEATPCHYVPSGIHERFFRPSPSPSRSRPFLLAVGTQERRKNFPFLVRVFSRLADDFPHLDLVLVGTEDNDSAVIRREIKKTNLHERVICTGYVADEVLLAYYRSALLLCVPSHYEGFGFPVLEALAVGTPVVCADRPAMTELGRQFVTAVACGDGQAWERTLRSLLVSPPGQARRQHGIDHARRFSWQETGRRMLEIYEEVYRNSRHTFGRSQTPERAVDPNSDTMPAVENAVFRTIVFADVFDFPLRQDEIHHGLLACKASPDEVKWATDRLITRRLLAEAEGYYFLEGRRSLIALRQRREQNTRGIFRQNTAVLRLVASFPFVEAVAVSGAAAFGNCKENDDLDLFVIVRPRRLWTVYAALAAMLKLVGKRETLCLNYLIAVDAEESLQPSFFVAHQIVHLRPLYGHKILHQYGEKNGWTRRFLPQGGMRAHVPEIAVASWVAKRVLEAVFAWRMFDLCEMLVRKIYAARIRRQTGHLGDQSVAISPTVIRLFTNDHSEQIIQKFQRRLANLDNKISAKREKENGERELPREQAHARAAPVGTGTAQYPLRGG